MHSSTSVFVEYAAGLHPAELTSDTPRGFISQQFLIMKALSPYYFRFSVPALALLVLSVNYSLADEWDFNKPDPDHIVKLCEIGGSAVRYSNVSVPGYEPCGELSTRVVCNAPGRKMIVPKDAPIPESYIDCSRIMVKRLDPPIEVNDPRLPTLNSLFGSASRSAKPQNEKPRRHESAEQLKGYQQSLDALLSQGGAPGVGTNPQDLQGLVKNLSQLLGGSPGGGSFGAADPQAMQDLLKGLNSGSAANRTLPPELLKALGGAGVDQKELLKALGQ